MIVQGPPRDDLATSCLRTRVALAEWLVRAELGEVDQSMIDELDSEELAICEKPQPVSWYMRLTVKDQRGIVARVAEVIAREDINIDSLEQEPHMPKDRLSFVITVEPVSEPTIARAVEAINAFPFMVEPVLLLRIE